MMSPGAKSVKSPLQMVGLYLAWVESVMGIALWAIKGVDDWPRTLLIVAIVTIGLLYAGVVAFLLIYIAVWRPHLLFNPSDYAPAVQPLLFDPNVQIEVEPATDQVEKPQLPE